MLETQLLRLFASAIFALILVGCSSNGPVEETPLSAEVDSQAGTSNQGSTKTAEPAQATSAAVVPTVKPPRPEDYPAAPFGKEVLYELLVAEIAGYRGQYDQALKRYVTIAEETRDPGVAARATRLAAYLRKPEEALTAARIWTEADPQNVDAHRHASDQLMKAGDLEQAIQHMEAVKKLGGLANFEVFGYRAASLDSEARKRLLETVTGMLTRYPSDSQLLYARAVLLSQERRHEESLEIAEQLLVASQEVNIIVLKVSALRDLKRSTEAVSFLESIMPTVPDNRRLRLMYSRLLFETDNLEGARQQYELVLAQSPSDGDVLFALALIAMEQEQTEVAQNYFQQMIRWNKRAGEAHYYLGSLAEKVNDIPRAIREYRQAGTGYEFLPAHGRVSALLAQQDNLAEARENLAALRKNHPDRADQLLILEAQLLIDRDLRNEVFELLDAAISLDTNNTDLLYFRAMTGEQFDDLNVLERDLRRIIELEPENADALNALGYTLTDRTDRHEEALTLIEQALTFKPGEPAFIDSLGWVHYRLNNLDLSIVHLRQALELLPNDEVAAHLGEVLWVAGDKREARQIWQEALESKPESEILKEVMDRLDS